MNTVTTLENLTEKVRENGLRELAYNIVKYQNFKTNAIVRKIDNAGVSENTLMCYINLGITYIKTGKKSVKNNQAIYNFIDEALSKCITPLTPTEVEKRGKFTPRMTKKKVAIAKTTSVQKVLNQISNKAKEDSKYQLAIRVGDSLRLANNQDYAKAFLDGMKFLGKMDAKLVRIKIEEVNE